MRRDSADRVPTDSAWIVIFGQAGLVGLTAFLGLFAVPAGAYAWRAGPLLAPERRAQTALALAVALYGVDLAMNLMPNLLLVTAAGALAATVALDAPCDSSSSS